MQVSTSNSIVNRWQSRFNGLLLAPSHNDYKAACQIWNGMIERSPALIARCASTTDVASAIRLAQSEHLPISVRGGGHGVAGNALCHDGLVIDLTAMKEISIDPDAHEIVAGAGVLWREFDQAAETHQLATTGGQVSHTGIAGLTLGGGLGYLMGKHGAACDNLLSVELVTAAGEVLTVSDEAHPDLFWAIRGAGANFGVVTQFRYRLHPLPGVLAGLLIHPRVRATEFIDFYREFLPNTPDELYTTLAFLNLPDGTPIVGIIAVYSGPIAEGERVLAPLRKFGPPIADLIGPMPYTAAQRLVDDAVPIGNRYYWKSSFTRSVSQELATVLHRGADAMPSPRSLILLFEMKGAIQRVSKESMAFDHRDANFEMSIIAEWTDSAHDAANIGWARDLWTATQPFVMSSVYSNHMTADEPPDRVRAAYGASKFERLAGLKAKYDPTNLFRMNHNIAPAMRPA
jgi:FAD/FMN-containing dehydrogenase